MNNLEYISQNLYIIRKAHGITHLKITKELGISRPILSGIENNSINPTLNTLEALCNYFHLSFNIIILSHDSFNIFQKLLNRSYSNNSPNEFDLIINDNDWKKLMKLSLNKSKSNIGKISALVKIIIDNNFPDIDFRLKSNMIVCAVNGIILQEDGFKKGLDFGCWLGYNLSGLYL